MLISDWCDQRTGNTEIFCRRTSISSITGISNIEGAIPFTCFPNPTSNDITLGFTLINDQQVSISLCDMQGRELKKITSSKFSKGDHKINVSTSSLAAGNYLFRLQSGSSVSRRSFSKVK